MKAKIKTEGQIRDLLRAAHRQHRLRMPTPEFASDWDRRIASYALENGLTDTAKHFGVEPQTVRHLLGWFSKVPA